MRFAEFYPEKQGRPDTKVGLDNDQHGPSIPYGYIKGAMLIASLTDTEESSNFDAGSQTVILVNAGAGPVTITLPAVGTHVGKYYYIKKIDSSSNAVTITGNGTIDGETSIKLTLQYSYVMIFCDGDEWFLLGGGNVKIENLVENLTQVEETNLERIVLELKKIGLHLSSMSNETIDDDTVSEEV